MEDFISGVEVKDTPEEEIVQIFSKRLVDEYGYDKKDIQTRPQYKIKESPSDKEKYPIDIAVFKDKLFIIVECKSKTRKEGIGQLKTYLSLSSAQIGVWFNGTEHVFLQKISNENSIDFKTLPEIPKKYQKIKDIGRHKRKELVPPYNLKIIFKDIRNHLVGMTVGITRGESLAQEIINILFCKIWDEMNTKPEDMVTVRVSIDDTKSDLRERIKKLFEEKVKEEYSDVFENNDTIKLDDESLFYVVSSLQNYSITEAKRDVIGEAFEVFIGPTLRGGEGQFFTPRNAVKMIVDVLNPSTHQTIIDPACGSGGFLIVALEKLWEKITKEGREKNWSLETIAFKKKELATKLLHGIDKDVFLSKVTKVYMALMGDGRGGIFCENALGLSEKIKLNKFDIVVTNPPFGSKIKVEGETILSQFELGHKWKYEKSWIKQQKVNVTQSPQILFIERCIQLLKEGGKMGMILPESLFANPTYGYIVEFLKQKGEIIGIVSFPEELFQPYTHAKTCVLFFKKTKPKDDYDIMMGIANYCGHDSRGNEINLDDIPKLCDESGEFGFKKSIKDIKNNILIPKYYDPAIQKELKKLEKTHNLIPIKQLIDNNIIEISTGVEIGKMSYGTGNIPFIRTSDISNWEIKIDPKHGISQSVYDDYKEKCDLQKNDILLVRDGTYLVGTSAIITENDLPSLFQSHIYKIRAKNMSPFLLLTLLSTDIVKKQIKSKQFTQDIIDTLGSRINEIILPIPKDSKFKQQISRRTKNIITQRTKLKKLVSKITRDVEKTSFGD